MIMNVISVALWIPALILRFALILIGLVAVPLSLIGDGADETPKFLTWFGKVEDIPYWWESRSGQSYWSKFVWMAIRNPTQGFAFEQPVAEIRPNPDSKVRSLGHKSAHRWQRFGWKSEYWYLREVGIKYFEFRIGWKFSGPDVKFGPTMQVRLGG